MTQNPRIKLPLTNPNSSTPSPNVTATPSVPISVYRQLAGELEATQDRVEALQEQNQRLVQQNRQLRQEITGILQSAQHLQQFVNNLDRTEVQYTRPVNKSKPEIAAFPRNIVNPLENIPQTPPVNPKIDNLSTSQPPTSQIMEVDQHTMVDAFDDEEKTGGMNGWFLAIAIFLISLTTFSMVFIIVRPLLNQHQNQR